MIIVGYSNNGRMLPDIKSTLNNWNITRSTTMTSEDTKLWATQEQEEALNGNTVIIHVGTNDIRHGRKARTILESIKKAGTTVEEKGAKCLIMQPPPPPPPHVHKQWRCKGGSKTQRHAWGYTRHPAYQQHSNWTRQENDSRQRIPPQQGRNGCMCQRNSQKPHTNHPTPGKKCQRSGPNMYHRNPPHPQTLMGTTQRQ